MTRDIHICIEEKRGTTWHPMWRRPSPTWVEMHALDLVEDGSAITLLGPPTEEELARHGGDDAESAILFRRMRGLLLDMGDEALIEKFWQLQNFHCLHLPDSASDLERRQAEWFDLLVRHGRAGLPEDVSAEFAADLAIWGSDAHSVGHISVEELVSLPDLIAVNPAALFWIRRNISDHANKRIIFFFDN